MHARFPALKRLNRLLRATVAAAAVAACTGTGPAGAAITGSAVASGSYRGQTVRSDEAVLSLDVEPASPMLSVSLDGRFDDGDGIPGKSVGDAVDYAIAVENAGDVGIAGVALTLSLMQAGEAFSLSGPPVLAEGDTVNPGVLDRGETWLFSARYPVEFANLEADAAIEATAAVSGLGTGQPVDGRARAAVEMPPLQDIAPRLISLSHVPMRAEVDAGETVDYTITISNRSERPLSARVTGMLDEGIALLDPTATDAEPDPALTGVQLDFGTIEVAAAGSATVRYTGRIAEGAVRGFHVNTAVLADPATGLSLIPQSRATIQTGPARQTGCAGISITVFEDANRDGRPGEDETGISGVRVAAEGSPPLTTDPDGEFFSPCVSVSRLAGIELRFDLDEGTLPDGYFVTTANPRAIRIERGETGRVAFGAAEARVVRVDLNAASFLRGSTVPDAELAEGITRLISVLGREPSILRLTYHVNREAEDLAEERLSAVRQTVLDYWAASDGGYDLKIDARVVAGGG